MDRDKYMSYLKELRVKDGQEDTGQSLGRLPKKGRQIKNAFPGFNFVTDPSFMDDLPRQKLKFMPRPIEQVCKSYPHIARMLTDPRVRKMNQGPQKHSVHVSMPSVPSMPSLRGPGGSISGSLEDDGDIDEIQLSADADAFDAQAPLPAVRQAGPKGSWRSKSSPGLTTGALFMPTWYRWKSAMRLAHCASLQLQVCHPCCQP